MANQTDMNAGVISTNKIKGNGSTLAWNRLSKSVAGAADVTLSSTECESTILELTGALTGNINVIVPLTDGSPFEVYNGTTGAFSLTMKGATGTGIAIPQGQRRLLYTDGTNVYDGVPFRMGGRLSKSVAGNSDVTLNASEALFKIIEFTGALTGNINVLFPVNDSADYFFYNGTSGAFSLTVKVSGQTGFAVGQGKRATGYCNATDIVRAGADV